MTEAVRVVRIGSATAGGGRPPLIIAGPCVLEPDGVAAATARALKAVCAEHGLDFVFKSSFDKANRTSMGSYRGPGIDAGLNELAEIRSSLDIPVISDIHSPEQAARAAEVLDAIQIPAFLCRQTDIVLAAARTGLPVNIKKGQFLSPWDAKNIVDKFTSSGSDKLLLTERGVSFGYNNLVVDMRSFPVMRTFGFPVIFDVTHSLQLPGGLGGSTGGQREFAGTLLRAAVAAGVDGLFLEVHPQPEKALCDGTNMVPLDEMPALLGMVRAIHDAVSGAGGR